FCKLSKVRREEIENLEYYDNLISHIEDLHRLRDYSMVNEDISGYIQTPF
ncbi:MAG TPA: site-specific DNA-methyltransferase, partial [Parabacteroides sp.]|nr:site-specific DNA-methyltransferase [Parabacteroides sp.]